MPRSLARAALGALGTTAALGSAVLAYSLIEARRPVLRRIDVPVLASGEEPLTILHLSDLHLTDRTEWLVEWVRDLAGQRPDVVINTGDNLSLASGLEPLRRALEPFLDLPGAFVMGDHDYRSTVFKLPSRYLLRDPRTANDPDREARIEALPWEEVRDLQACGGWADLTNRRDFLAVRGRRIELVGVDDPHADRDRFPDAQPVQAGSLAAALPSVRDASERTLRLGLLHAPYRRVLDAMVVDGVDLALAGHTHGGQLCVPGYGALVTNCDLDTGRASGLSRWPDGAGAPGSGRAPAGMADDGAAAGQPGMFLHVSAGLGTSPFTPVRIACPPQAALLTLRPA
ncbi:metallophosphoesterase [Actinomyces bowdenii]|uniref:metallophosphoesterase n=1 Tax=Actinomyces bowdenii TaxID=131109 RepID=UPI001ABC6A6B|nr:metallophosphoesterase [Actinomyces bowdenii]MBO3723551.1 metallophosphoesterase [Actinomyces bowdenii]